MKKERLSEKIIDNYFVKIPLIVFYLGLDSYELAFYFFIKKVIDESGFFHMDMKSISKELRMSESKLKRVKKTLAGPFPQLDDKGLIKINVRYSSEGGRLTDSITIDEIWEYL